MVGGADAKELGEVFVSRPRNFQMALTSTLSVVQKPLGKEQARGYGKCILLTKSSHC